MGKLENLLNAIIKMGWKPWGNDVDSIRVITKTILSMIYKNWNWGELQGIRKLVSLESWLWQFVCENELVPYQTSGQIIKRYVKETVGRYSSNILEWEVISSDIDYQYRLLESALLPEEKLEEFLLSNIIVEWSSK